MKENISVIIKELGEQETTSKFKLLSIQTSLSSRDLTRVIKSNGSRMLNCEAEAPPSPAAQHTYPDHLYHAQTQANQPQYQSQYQPQQQQCHQYQQRLQQPQQLPALVTRQQHQKASAATNLPITTKKGFNLAAESTTTTSTSSDTLVDADLSFNNLIIAPRSNPVYSMAPSNFIKPIPTYVQPSSNFLNAATSPHKVVHTKSNRFHVCFSIKSSANPEFFLLAGTTKNMLFFQSRFLNLYLI